MRRLPVVILWAAFFTPVGVVAETLYVTDQLTVPLRADAAPTAAVVKTVTTGAALEVIERGVGTVHVRDAQGIEGWADAAALSPQAPASTQVKSLRAELERTRTQLVQAQTQLDKARAASPASPAVEQLQTELAAAKNELAQAQADLKRSSDQAAQRAVAPEPPTPARASGSGGFSFLWLAIAFAMLVLGFIGGVVWVRESIRRRMGGLYLRI